MEEKAKHRLVGLKSECSCTTWGPPKHLLIEIPHSWGMGKDQFKQEPRVRSWQASRDLHQTKMPPCVPELPRAGNPEAGLSINGDRTARLGRKSPEAGSFQGKVPQDSFCLVLTSVSTSLKPPLELSLTEHIDREKLSRQHPQDVARDFLPTTP